MKFQNIALTILLAAVPLTAFAQGASGQNALMGNSTIAAQDTHRAGATGSTIVRGNRSTIAGDRRGSYEQRTGQFSGGGAD